jgi:hypothetical protein
MHRAAIALGTLVALSIPAGAQAFTFTATEFDDPKPGRCTERHCTLREAIIAANKAPGRDTVELPGHRRYELERRTTGEDEAADGDLDIISPVLIVHRGFRGTTVDANRIDRVFDVYAPATIRNVTVRRGSAHPVDGGGDGGGILTEAELIFKNGNIVGNRTTEPDGNGGGVDTDAVGKVQIRNAVIARNVAVGESGGVGGSINGPLRLDQVLIANNEGGEGGGVLAVGPVKITRSTIVGNRSLSGPDGELGDGGGVYVDDQGVLTVENSTITENFAIRSGGGVYGEPNAVASLSSATIARNRANSDDAGDGTSGGVHADSAGFELVNSIVALNVASGGAPSDCGGGPYGGTAPNLISTSAGGCGPGSEIVTADPMLGPLGDNGGATPTIGLLPGSPAIGAADPALVPERDQRATPRDDGDPDLGAFEL